MNVSGVGYLGATYPSLMILLVFKTQFLFTELEIAEKFVLNKYRFSENIVLQVGLRFSFCVLFTWFVSFI